MAEISAFPPSAVGVDTAVPAFIGYTQRAETAGIPVANVAVRIVSMMEYEQFFGQGVAPKFKLSPVQAPAAVPEPGTYDVVYQTSSGETVYATLESEGPLFSLYNSLRLFYANGGGPCYIVSVGSYEDKLSQEALLRGLEAVKDTMGPTLLVIPDASLLPVIEYGDVAKAMMKQAHDKQDRAALLDVPHTRALQSSFGPALGQAITAFRDAMGTENLSYGMTYFPLLIYLPPGAMPRAVGGNGAVVVGGLGTGGGFYWMPTTGVIYIGGKEAIAVSRDGQTIVGTGINAPDKWFEAGKWLRAAEWRLLGSFPPSPTPCDATLSTGYGSNVDGSIIVGLGHNGCSVAHAFRWDATTGVVDLGSSVAGRPSPANRISADGKVIVGWQGLSNGFRQGARWIDGRQELLVGPLGPVSEAQAINHDGSNSDDARRH